MSTFIVVPDQLTSLLSAVNAMIFTLGETGVDSLDPPPTTDAENALRVLSQVDLDVQTRGWHWNREDAYPLTRDGDGKLVLPNQTLHAVISACDGTTRDVVQRGDYLYDRKAHSYVFTEDMKADLIVRLDWELLPQSARSYILYEACSTFHASLQERTILLRVNEGSVRKALVSLEQAEDAWARTNVVGQTPVQSALGSANRNRAR